MFGRCQFQCFNEFQYAGLVQFVAQAQDEGLDVEQAREVGHAALTRNEVVADMQVRKQRMIELSDAFLTLPGGLGTLDELFEVLTLRQLREHDKPILVVDDEAYFAPLVACLRSIVAHELASQVDIDVMERFDTPEAALARLGLHAPPT